MLTVLDKAVYSARQGVRVAWYMGHYFASRSYHKPQPHSAEPRPARKAGPSRERFFGDIGQLFESDLANVEAGHYPLPRDQDGSILERIGLSRKYFADLPATVERMAEGRGEEVRSPEFEGRLPEYFLQNFHYQTGGYLTEESAQLYDMQVEVLFSGTANAMRRHCLVPLADYMGGRDQRRVVLLDVGCGTGRFLRFVKEAYPRIGAAGADLSEAYLAEARRHLVPYRDVTLHAAAAERLPFPDGSVDLVTSVYLFHELPPEVRRAAAAEFARVLKRGGRLIFMDSLQIGDIEVYDSLLESFPSRFHEPYYESYAREDLVSIFGSFGLKTIEEKPVFLSKLIVAEKA